MRLNLTADKKDIVRARQAAYLAKWPVEKQLEAFHDAANGRPEKLDRMNGDFAEVRERLPKS